MIIMAPEITETSQKGHEVSLQGDNILSDRARSFSALSHEFKHLSIGRQANTDSETDVKTDYEKSWLENYHIWSTFYPSLLKDTYLQPHPLDGFVYPSNPQPYYGTHLYPQYAVQMVPQNYPPEYCFQEFQYFVVIDFEATCDEHQKPHPQEIIEFPSVLVNGLTGQLEDCFQIYVRPTHNQQLSEFCKDLTGIHQSQVDKGVLLSDALLMHDKWLQEKGVKDTNFAVVTWSNWDCRVMLESECRFKRIWKPSYFDSWINLKVPFSQAFGAGRCNLKEAVERAGLTWEGRAHCGLDDAKNTARIVTKLMECGLKLLITNNLMWQSTDQSNVLQQQNPAFTTPETKPGYLGAPYKSKVLPYNTVISQQTGHMKDPRIYCYCGAASAKREFQKRGHKKGGFVFVCGNCTPKGPGCSFYKWVPVSEPAKA